MHKVLESLIENRKEWLIGTIAFISGTALLIAYFQSGPRAIDFGKAEVAVLRWQASPEDEKLYETMRFALQSVPQIGKKYEAAIAQKLIGTQKIGEALAMASRSIQRVKGEAPFHSAYAKTSLLIEQGAYQQALEDTVALKELMGEGFQTKTKGGSLLYALNLLRIASLQQKLKNRPGEKAAWEELEECLAKNQTLSQQVISCFSDQKVDLKHYILERKKWL